MNHIKWLFIVLAPYCLFSQAHTIVDASGQRGIAYATISFGNGNGIFADADGLFKFPKKLYKDIDSLYISALGYKETALSTSALPATIRLIQHIDELQEVVITSENLGPYKKRKKNPIIHNDYFRCWLPTVESEIAVFFDKKATHPIKITHVTLPVMMESKKGSGKKQSFSTLFKMQFYKNEKGYPGKRLPGDAIIFRITNKDKSNFELDITERKVFIPEEGIFIAIQVLGYTDAAGKLQHTKKYHEVATRKGIVKVSTTFRPLLPFTNKIAHPQTFTRRIFFKNRTWLRFDKEYSEGNNLIKGNHINYGMGIKTHEYQPKKLN